MLQNEVSKAKGPIELFDTEPKPQDRPRRAAAPEEGAKTAIAQKARKGVSDALQGGKAAPGLKAERCHLPARELRERRELIVPPPRARAKAIGDGSVTKGRKNMMPTKLQVELVQAAVRQFAGQ